MTGKISRQIIATTLEQTAKKLAVWSENKSSTCTHTSDIHTPADEHLKTNAAWHYSMFSLSHHFKKSF